MACLAWTISGLNEWTFLHGSIELSVAMGLLAVLVPALVFGLAVLLWRQFVLVGKLGRAALSFAAVWVTFEFAMQTLSANSTSGNIAYSQMNCLPTLQVASLAGPSGIDFLLFFIPGALAALFVGKATLRHRLILTGFVGALLTLTLTWGASRLANTSRKDPRVKVGLIASDLPQNIFPQAPEAQQKLFSEYDAQVARLMDEGAELVVLPEKIARVEDRPQFSSLHDSDAVVVAGIEFVNGGQRSNEALLSWPGSTEPWHYIYRKHHLVPGFEDRETPGTERLVLPTATGKWGVEICKDMDFPALSRQYGKDEVGLMIVPAWDFVKDDWLHDRMAVMRGVED
jgi:apolipoprotein N-acyltransferase